MDLLFKRYASPFDYMDSLMTIGNLEDGIRSTIKEANEEKLWSLYLHSYQKVSFKEWREQVIVEKPKELSQAEMTTIIEQSNNILKSFHM